MVWGTLVRTHKIRTPTPYRVHHKSLHLGEGLGPKNATPRPCCPSWLAGFLPPTDLGLDWVFLPPEQIRLARKSQNCPLFVKKILRKKNLNVHNIESPPNAIVARVALRRNLIFLILHII